MKFKYYLRGAGVGVLITTIIFACTSFYNKTYAESTSAEEAEISDEEIISRAVELGMVMQDEADNQDITKSTEEAENPEGTDESTEEAGDDTAENDADETGDVVKNYIAFSVRGGESSNSVADHLYDAGLIDNADSFNKYMNKLGVDGLIQAGSFYLAEGSSYEDIISVLITKQENRDTTPPEATVPTEDTVQPDNQTEAEE